ncbi:MAG TPA: DUF1699 family protein [Candidatus Nanoarchaeia archaeon]|nr:DUF1699 family protein [Candidatus Nanoarchaeia archaeon]
MEVVFCVIGSENDLDDLNSDEINVHFCFRPSEKDIFKLTHKCPNVKIVQLPESYSITLSNTTKTLLSMKNVEIHVGNVWGHRTDLDKYITVDI